MAKTRFVKGPYSHRTHTEVTQEGDTIFPTPTPPPPPPTEEEPEEGGEEPSSTSTRKRKKK